MNAPKHGLRAREFGLLPEEDPEEWRQHVRDLMDGYRPVDATEEKLVSAIAAAMWKEIRADRFEAGVLTVPPHHTPARPRRRAHHRDPLRHRPHPPRPTRLPRAPEGQAGRPAADGAPEHARTRASKRHERFSRQPPPVPSPQKSTNDFTDPLAGLDWSRPRHAVNGPAQRPRRPARLPQLCLLACPLEPERQRFTSGLGCGHE